MRARHRLLALLLLLSLMAPYGVAGENQPAFLSAPSLIKAGGYSEFVIDVPAKGEVSLSLVSRVTGEDSLIMSGYPVEAGENRITWDGVLPSYDSIPVGEYYLRLDFGAGLTAQTPVRVGVPYPTLTGIQQSQRTLVEDNEVIVAYYATTPGTLFVQLFRYEDDTIIGETSMTVEAGENRFSWNGMLHGERLPVGEYALVLSLRTESGVESMQHYVYVDIEQQAMSLVDFETMTRELMERVTPPQTQTAAPGQVEKALSPPYGATKDGTFWAMHPGELNDRAIWEIMTQPITVYDDGRIGSVGHVFMMENMDGSGRKIAQIHGKSQGIHVLGEPNQYGYVYVEAFSNYDPSYTPTTPEEKAHAFDIRRGYLLAEHLKTVEVAQDIGFLVDKLTQRMYIFIDGVRVTELTISTGKGTDKKYYRETIAGEFITVGHSGGFWSNDLYCAMAIRFNGGTLFHETPYSVGVDGTKYYGLTEPYLGTKRSGGCVRVPRKKNPEGYNMTWIWRNLDSSKRYKVLIWDDINRVDTPVTWR